MARLLALQWNSRELRYVLARTQGPRVTIPAAAVIPVDETGGLSAAMAQLRKDLKQHGGARVAALVAVDRGQVDIQHLQLPPAQDHELPSLGLLQLERDGMITAEHSVVDLIPVPGSPSEPREATALILDRAALTEMQQLTRAAGLQLRRVLVRSYETSNLLAAQSSSPDSCLLVNRVGQEIDLTVVQGDKVTLSRTSRLPQGSETEQTTRLVSEVKRTLAVASVTPGMAGEVEQVYVVGPLGECDHLLIAVQEQLAVPVSLLDPFESFTATDESLPRPAAAFAPLLGMIAGELRRPPHHTVDFLAPRQSPQPANRQRTLVLAGIVLLSVVALGAFQIRSQLTALDEEVSRLEQRAADLKGVLEDADQQVQLTTALETWQQQGVIWLDELRDLSLRFPPTEEAIVRSMNISTGRGGVGAINLQGVTRSPAVLSRFEQQLRDQYHEVRSRRVQQRSSVDDYSWQFESSIIVAPRPPSAYRSTSAP